ncbi:hypothetical protein BIFBRE_05090, partial [Bifidobacterium breve DSM 20213 = JCM 1192]
HVEGTATAHPWSAMWLVSWDLGCSRLPVAVVEDEPPMKIAKGAAQSPVAVAVTRFAASPFAESKDIHLSYTKELQKLLVDNFFEVDTVQTLS